MAQRLLVVSAEWILNNVGGKVKLVDTRRLIDYRLGHVPGAVSIPFTSFVEMRGLAYYLPNPIEFEKVLRARGISNDDLVIAYDDYWGKHASRLLYTLEVFGHQKLGVLDRPFRVYEEEKFPITKDETLGEQTEYRSSLQPSKLVTKETILSRLSEPGFGLLDTRAPEDLVFGCIPGAKGLPWLQLTSSKRVFRPRDELDRVVGALSLPTDSDVVTYCDEGTSSVLVMYALRELGYDRAENYLASYGEWGSDPTLPKEKPSQK